MERKESRGKIAEEGEDWVRALKKMMLQGLTCGKTRNG